MGYKHGMTNSSITLAIADAADYPAFKRELQEAFAIAVIAENGALPDGPIPSDQELDTAIAAPDSVVLRILSENKPVGGAIVTIDDTTHRNALDLFFIKSGEIGRGLGYQAWIAIEQRYPQTLTWETHTPYFEKRNIHFYVNKCGFKIVEFFNTHHPDKHRPSPDEVPGLDEGFRFEKVM